MNDPPSFHMKLRITTTVSYEILIYIVPWISWRTESIQYTIFLKKMSFKCIVPYSIYAVATVFNLSFSPYGLNAHEYICTLIWEQLTQITSLLPHPMDTMGSGKIGRGLKVRPCLIFAKVAKDSLNISSPSYYLTDILLFLPNGCRLLIGQSSLSAAEVYNSNTMSFQVLRVLRLALLFIWIVFLFEFWPCGNLAADFTETGPECWSVN